MNSKDCSAIGANQVIKIDQKKLQMKWTDIEVRKHVMPKMQKESLDNDSKENELDIDDDWPPLEKVELKKEEQDEEIKQERKDVIDSKPTQKKDVKA